MLHKDLAKALGISGAMVSRLAKRGMPTDTVERAMRWRSRHLEPARTKAWRMGAPRDEAAAAAPVALPTPAAALRQVYYLATLAAELLPVGQFAVIEPRLRAALRALPPHCRGELMIACPDDGDAPGADACTAAAASPAIPLAVLDALTADVLAIVREESGPEERAAELSDAEAEWMAEFWFDVAAGVHVPSGRPST